MPRYQIIIEKREVHSVEVSARDRWEAEFIGNKLCLDNEKISGIEMLKTGRKAQTEKGNRKQ